MKKIFRFLFKFVVGIIGAVALYILLALILPFIPVQAEQTNESKTISAYILTNGVHTDLVVPIKTNIIDWSQKLPFESTRGQRTDFNYVAFGWGDKGFYLDTPTWAELKPSTAFKAAFWLGSSAMHCTFYRDMTIGDNCKAIPLTENQYKRLVCFIDNKFQKDINGNYKLVNTKAVYGDDDAFYNAEGSYNFTYTCNTWANNGLKAAGQKAALWTASDFGIFNHYK